MTKKPLQFSYDPSTDVITIEGVDYAGDVFRNFGQWFAPGQLFEFTDRDHSVVEFRRHEATAEELEALLAFRRADGQ